MTMVMTMLITTTMMMTMINKAVFDDDADNVPGDDELLHCLHFRHCICCLRCLHCPQRVGFSSFASIRQTN